MAVEGREFPRASALPRVHLPSLCVIPILLHSAIFLYTAGPATFRPLTAALDSSHFGRVGVISLNSAMKNFHHRKRTTSSTQARTRFSRMGLLTNRLAETATHHMYDTPIKDSFSEPGSA